MFPTPPKPINTLAAAQKAVTAEHEAGVLAMKQAVDGDGPAPDNLSAAAVLVARLKRELDAARAEVKEHAATAMATIKGDNEKFSAISAALRSVVADQPEASDDDVVIAVGKLVTRLRHTVAESKADLAFARESMTLALTHMGMTQVPGLENLFISHSPLLACAEASAVQLFGDKTAKESYLRRRGWIFTGNTGWRDPQRTGNFPFDSAVTVQAKRDIVPFKGLGSRQWKGIPKNEVKYPPMAKEDSEIIEQAMNRGESVSALASV